jgi:hypothetical protein
MYGYQTPLLRSPIWLQCQRKRIVMYGGSWNKTASILITVLRESFNPQYIFGVTNSYNYWTGSSGRSDCRAKSKAIPLTGREGL